MTSRSLQCGDIVTVRFPMQIPQGHEQEGYRPAIIVGLPTVLGTLRFPLIITVPLTTDKRQAWALASPNLYIRLPAKVAGLSSSSIALLDQIRAVDAKRIVNYRGSLTPDQYRPILEGLQRMMVAS